MEDEENYFQEMEIIFQSYHTQIGEIIGEDIYI